MIELELNYTDWKNNVDTKELKHFSVAVSDRYQLFAFDGPIIYKHFLDQNDVADFETNYLPTSNQRVSCIGTQQPFQSKKLPDGSKLYRRKHRASKNCATGENTIDIVVSYAHCKIDCMEFIGCHKGDRVDLKVYAADGTTLLNQFGFDAAMRDEHYLDKSDYDADLYEDLIVRVIYKNNSGSSFDLDINYTLHEVVAP